MGYSEVRCQLCAVSFNVGRVRRADEPPNAAFAFAEQNLYLDENFVRKDPGRRNQCPADSGCSNIKIAKRQEQHLQEADTWLQTGDDDDSDWNYQSEEDNEPLEWEENDDAMEISDNEAEEGGESSSWDFNANLNLKPTEAGTSGVTVVLEGSGSSEGSESGDDDDSFAVRYKRCRNLEHLAGPGCSNPRGYNGNNITAEEMSGSCTVQCLVRKDRLWRADPNDEEFEISSNYFLSGLGGHMNSRDYGGLKAIPKRHGLEDEIYPDDHIWGPGNEVPMPFHPACLEIYRRVSQSRFGNFDVNGLCQWRLLECDSGSEVPLLNHSEPAIQRALGQEWYHAPGDEWLAANPLFVPALPRTLQKAVHENAVAFDPRDSAFPTCRVGTRPNSEDAQLEDCFHVLPREVLLLVVETLRSPDIAALRLASRTFTHLPILLWRKLLIEEMPWLWEVWDHNLPSKWTMVSVSEIKSEEERIRKAATELRSLQRLHREVIQKEMPECWEQYSMDHPWITEDVDTEERVAIQQNITRLGQFRSIYSLPQDRTNWYEVYRLITKHWGHLKGLKNRQRIWSVCEAISDRISQLTEEGKIVM